MQKEEYEEFLNRTLILIENARNFLLNDKHIISYNKMLGVQQKLEQLTDPEKTELSVELIKVRSVIYYLTEGRYKDAMDSLEKARESIYKIYGQVGKKYENNRN